MKNDEMKDDDFKLLRGFGNGLTDGRTVNVESLLQLKNRSFLASQ